MNKKNAGLLGGVVGILLWAGWYAVQTPTPIPETKAPLVQTPAPPSNTPREKPGEAPVARRKPQPKIELPLPTQLREETRANPHVTPPSLLAFASDLSVRLQPAMENEELAEAFVGDLTKCVLSNDAQTTVTVRALCLRHARLLVSRFDSLTETVKKLEGQVDSETRQLAE